MSTHLHRVHEVFDRALACPAAERAALLDDACGDDGAFRAEVEALLANDRLASEDFLRPPRRPLGLPAIGEREDPERLIGERVGGCRIKSVISAGGMGTVYEALQEQPPRTVALKIMHRNVASQSTLRRFQFESEVLARLRHPHIAQVYAAGMHGDESAGVPYFVMEYVPDAKTIIEHAESRNLTTRQRLDLFAKVCDAVHHGHARGIIHRDLKPGNILVAGDDLIRADDPIRAATVRERTTIVPRHPPEPPSAPSSPDAPPAAPPLRASVPSCLRASPKIIDFGIARATDSDVAVTTMQTDAGQLVGTLQYMSPEQCDADPHEMDIRSDVYSLGVVLYELLAGRLPYQTGGTSIYQATQIVKETAPPPLSTVSRRLRGNIETIVSKSLAKDRTQRYQTAADLADDIRRHLTGEPIEARPATAWTRAVRWAARRPVPVTGAASFLIGAALMAFWMTLESTKSEYEDFAIAIHVVAEGQRAWVESLRGESIHEWRADRPGGIAFASLVHRPAKLGEGKWAIVGFTSQSGNEWAGEVCAFDLDGNLGTPIWNYGLADKDLLPQILEDDSVCQVFSPKDCWVADIFPDSPGPEIVATYAHSFSHCLIRVYDLTGKTLYQAWHDGTVSDVYWMDDAGLLIVTGLNSEASPEERGVKNVTFEHARVIFALDPRHEFAEPALLRTRADLVGNPDDPLSPRWYKTLLPAEVTWDVFRQWKLFAPTAGDPGRTVQLIVGHSDPDAHVGWEIHEYGEFIPGTRVASDSYRRDLDSEQPRLPALDALRLGPLPAIATPAAKSGPRP